MNVVFLGSGNVATHLSQAMQQAGMTILQVYSPTAEHARELADKLNCPWTTDVNAILPADLYIFCLKDVALPGFLRTFPPHAGLWVHTAGSMPLTVFEGYTKRYGTLYPLQTFSKGRDVYFNNIPLFIESNNPEDEILLLSIAESLSGRVQLLSSEKRRYLHLAAVFACNFTNHMYALASEILEANGIDRKALLPLIDETAAKIHSLTPAEAQTGPAVRYDENVIAKHLEMLDDPLLKEIYQSVSNSIHKHTT